ncbi:MAG: hypothetical protein NT007_06290 [Candidatus Kapabacteria bacterium]|nr:hypothetical protein [Candidatus Kapabacteria bacterium]
MWIEVFKTGVHTDKHGYTENFDASKLNLIAEKYNSKISGSDNMLAPLVKGHPTDSDPAYGWVERLAVRGKKLYAKIKDLSVDLWGDIQKGAYKQVSISLYPDSMLRHIGVLGAVRPAVKELNDLSAAVFEENKNEKIFEFTSTEVDFQVDECLISNEEIIPDNETEKNKDKEEFSETNCKSETMEQATNDFDETKQKLIEFAEANIRLETQNQIILNKLNLTEKEARLKNFREFANSLIENPDGAIITPASADKLIDILEHSHILTEINKKVANFSEEYPIVEQIENFLLSLKPAFFPKEFAVKTKTNEKQKRFEFKSKNVSPERLKIHEKALEIQSITPGLSYEEATCTASRELEYFI